MSRTATGIWRLADPKITMASAASLLLGASAAASAGPPTWGWLAATVVGIFFIEVAKNASGEVFDFDSGADLAVAPADRSPFSGGKRVLVDGLLTRAETFAVAAVGYVLAAVAGLGIVAAREPKVIWLGLLGTALAFFYHAPPLRLSYRGGGELAVAIAYGPLIAEGTYLVQHGHASPPLLWLSVALGLLIAAFLWINEFPDCAADAAAGKRTLVVRLGRRRAARAYGVLVAVAYLLLAAAPLIGLPSTVWLGLLAAPWPRRLAADPPRARDHGPIDPGPGLDAPGVPAVLGGSVGRPSDLRAGPEPTAALPSAGAGRS
jgi:1,4-dihydroxy-2-naphthoate octaprenyltransferase